MLEADSAGFVAMDSTQPMWNEADDASNSSAASNALANKVIGVLTAVGGGGGGGGDEVDGVGEMAVMGGENKVGRVKDRCDIAIDNKVRD